MTDNIVKMENIIVYYRSQKALEVGTLEIPPGRTLIVGPNGSGKTTLVNVLVGLVRPRKGRVKVLGLDPIEDADKLYARLTYVRDSDELPDSLKLSTWLEILKDMFEPGVVRESVRLLELESHLEKRLGELSKGLRRRVSLLLAIVSDRDIIIVDEPFSGLDFNSRTIISKLLDKKSNNMIIVSHIPPPMRFDYLVVVEGGGISFSGSYEYNKIRNFYYNC